MEYKIIKFKNNNKVIGINIDEHHKTTWFTNGNLQLLFDRDKSSISRQINSALNIVNQKEATVTKSVTVHIEQGRKDRLTANNIEPKINLKTAFQTSNQLVKIIYILSKF